MYVCIYLSISIYMVVIFPSSLLTKEQKVLPFCFLPRSHARLRLLRLASSHGDLCAQLRTRCETLRRAADEAMTSTLDRGKWEVPGFTYGILWKN